MSADADVVIVAGCGVHADNEGEARHNGIHRFFLEPGAHVLYQEKHIGTGTGSLKRIDPITDIYLKENAVLEMDTVQLRGVDVSERSTHYRYLFEGKRCPRDGYRAAARRRCVRAQYDR